MRLQLLDILLEDLDLVEDLLNSLHPLVHGKEPAIDLVLVGRLGIMQPQSLLGDLFLHRLQLFIVTVEDGVRA
jgi:hypothetical protein